MKHELFEVWSAVAGGLHPGPRFRLLADATRYVDAQPLRESLGIRNPDGSWYTSPYGPDLDDQQRSLVTDMTVRKVARRAGSRCDRILVVEDDVGSRNALAALLRDERYEVTTASDGTEALAHIDANPPDLVITDVMMPNTDGFQLVKHLRERAALSDIPIILVSAVDDATRRVDGLDLGADDYLPKPLDVDELLARVRVHLRHSHRSREIVARCAIDELTGTLNRRGVMGVLDRERERARRDRTCLAVLVIDVDDFKSINDRFGHGVGDEVLRCVAGNLVRAVRANDRVGRFGGDEFMIVAPNTGLAAVEILTRRIQNVQQTPLDLGGGVELPITLSVGSAVDSGTLDADELFNRADAAMYRRKRLRSAH